MEEAIVLSLGKSSPNNSIFDEEYIIVFVNRQPEWGCYPAWTISLGDESNIDPTDEQLDTVTTNEAIAFINYYNNQTSSDVVLKSGY